MDVVDKTTLFGEFESAPANQRQVPVNLPPTVQDGAEAYKPVVENLEETLKLRIIQVNTVYVENEAMSA